jgi:hypothetical protein
MHVEPPTCSVTPAIFSRMRSIAWTGSSPLRADLGAIHDGAAAEQPVGIVVEVVEPLLCCTVRLSKMKRYAWISPAGPTNLSGFHQYDGHWLLQQAHRMHSYAPFSLSRSAGDCRRSFRAVVRD